MEKFIFCAMFIFKPLVVPLRNPGFWNLGISLYYTDLSALKSAIEKTFNLVIQNVAYQNSNHLISPLKFFSFLR